MTETQLIKNEIRSYENKLQELDLFELTTAYVALGYSLTPGDDAESMVTDMIINKFGYGDYVRYQSASREDLEVVRMVPADMPDRGWLCPTDGFDCGWALLWMASEFPE